MRSLLSTSLRRAALPLAGAAMLLSAVVPPAAGSAPAVTERVAPRAPAAPTAPLAPPTPDLPGLVPMSGDLAHLVVDSRGFRAASATYAEVADAHGGAQAARVGLDRAITEARAGARLRRAEAVAAHARIEGLRHRLGAVEAAITDLSIQLYVSGGSTARVDAALTQPSPSINDHDRRAVLGTSAMDVLLAERAAYRQRFDAATAAASSADEGLADASAAGTSAHRVRGDAVHDEVRTARRVGAERVRYEEARALATVDGVDFALVALDAYHRAARSVDADDPECGVSWWALAGISRVEGRHGTYGGAALDARGDATRRIIGIQLNGTNSTAVIADTDGGALDGDTAYDRAVGPMQFIPQTWSRFASDGNEDGVATPFNMYDATLAAARYLCRASRGLHDDAALRAAYFSYNHSQAYVERVLELARGYERALDLTPAD